MTTVSPISTGAILAVVAVGSITDIWHGIIPNRITYPALVALVTIAVMEDHATQAVLGMVSVALPLALLRLATFGRGLGIGDIKLGSCIGAALGAPLGLFALGAAFVVGGFVAIILLALRRAEPNAQFPFGPFLAFGTLIAVVTNVALPS